jgi:hypothetical protein
MAIQMHIVKRIKKKKSPAAMMVPRSSSTNTANTASKVQHYSFSKSDASKKETVYKRRRRPIVDIRFPSSRKFSLTENNAFNKAFAKNSQLRSDLGFSPSNVRL